MALVARASEYFHTDRIADRDVAVQLGVDPRTDNRPGVAQKLHPRRSVDQDHVVLLPRISLGEALRDQDYESARDLIDELEGKENE